MTTLEQTHFNFELENGTRYQKYTTYFGESPPFQFRTSATAEVPNHIVRSSVHLQQSKEASIFNIVVIKLNSVVKILYH